MADPRLHQIAALTGLLSWGVIGLDFEITPLRIGVLLCSAVTTEWGLRRALGRPFLWSLDWRSPLISGLSLCLLLRAESHLVAAGVAIIAIGSKYVLRSDGRHIFNPTAFGIVAGLALFERVWVSAGQWGSTALLVFAVVCTGIRVTHSAQRADITWAFLIAFVGMLFSRAIWLGDPVEVPLHSLQNGALLLFAFFMISDPRTSPDSRRGRIFFASMVALGALLIEFGLYERNGLLWSLVLCSPVVPLINRLTPGDRYEWLSRSKSKSTEQVPARVRIPFGAEGVSS